VSEPEELTIKIPGVELAAKAWGPVDGPLVLALHGWLDNAASFDGLAPFLPGLRLVALDLPGHGLSSHHGAGHLYAFIDMVGEVFWAVEALRWTKFALLGHSMGAGIAALLAGTFPERVVKLALLEGLGPLSESPTEAPLRLARALTEQRRKGGRPHTKYTSREDVAQRLLSSLSQITERSARTLLARGLEDTSDGKVKWRADRRHRFASRIRLTEEQVLAFLARIACPTLLVRASEGLPFASQMYEGRAAAVKNLEVVEVPGRHHVHLDYPGRVASALQRFLGSLVRS
jgi:pimeloyl-ACP methyl ester carboxylesterase